MIVKLIVDGGAMKPGPTVAQQLGPMGINLGKVIEDTNKATAGFKGMKVPVAIDVDPETKEFTISVSSPPVSELVKKEVGVDKGSGKAGEVMVGNMAIEQAISVAKTKMPDMLAKDLKAAVKLVVGSCVSAGVMVEGKPAKEVEIEIDEGKYDTEITEERTEVASDKLKKLQSSLAEVQAEQEAAAKAEEEAAKEEPAESATESEAKPEEKKEEAPKK